MKFRINPFLLASGLVATSLQAAPITKETTGTDLSQGESWVDGAAPGSGDVATWSGTSLGGGLTFGADTQWQGINHSGSSANTVITGANTLTLGSAGITLTGSQNLTIGSGGSTTNITLGASQEWSVAEGRTFTQTGRGATGGVLDLGGNELTVSGSGTTMAVSLPGVNLRNGSVLVSGGIFDVRGGSGGIANVDATTAITVSSGATYQIGYNAGIGNTSLFNQALTLNGGTFRKSDGVTNTVAVGGTITLGTGGGTIHNGGGGIWTIGSAIGGSTELALTGGGGLILSGTNNFTGGVALNRSDLTTISGTNAANTWTISNGSYVAGILVSNADAFASGSTLNITSSSANFPGGIGIADNTTGIVGAGSAVNITTSGSGRGMLQLGTNTNFGANTTISGSGPLQLQAGSGATISGNITFSATSNQLTIRHDSGITPMPGVTRSNTGTLTISGNLISSVGGAGSILAANSFTGTLALNGDNSSYSGNINTNGLTALSFSQNLGTGTVSLGNVGTASTLNYTGTGSTTAATINLSGTTGGATINQNGTGLVKFTSNLTATGAGTKTLTLSGSTAGTGEIAGAIVNNSESNTTSVTKAGTGTWTLSGTSTYTGATTVSAGTLLVSGALGNTAVSVGADGTIGGTGTLGGSLHFASGATLHIADIANALAITGNVTFGNFGFGNITGWDYTNADEGTYTLLAGSNFNLSNVSNVGAGAALDFGNGKQGYFQNGSLQVVIIPEPSAAALLGGMGLFLLLRRRRA